MDAFVFFRKSMGVAEYIPTLALNSQQSGLFITIKTSFLIFLFRSLRLFVDVSFGLNLYLLKDCRLSYFSWLRYAVLALFIAF